MRQTRTLFSLLMLLLCSQMLAQFSKSTYYAKANGKKGAELKTALAGIISNHTTISYDGLYEVYKTTDLRSDGKIWDMYSCTTNYDPDRDRAGSYKKEGDCFNREHSIPQSVFSERAPMKTDVYHVIPTDGYVNNRRSNYSFGEVGNVVYQSNNGFSKLGSPSSHITQMGCKEDRVFEPNDEYKGDQARSCFYFVTCYEDKMSSMGNYGMFSKNKYPSLSDWASKMLMEWAEKDQVSDKETNRVEAAYNKQHNRNPFIDFPGLEQYIWGSYKDVAFSVENYVNPYSGQIIDQPDPDTPDQPDPDTPDQPDPDTPDQPDPDTPDQPGEIIGDYAYVKVITAPTTWQGEYLFVNEEGSLAFDGSQNLLDKENNWISVIIEDGTIHQSSLVDCATFFVTPSVTMADAYNVKSQSGLYIGMTSTTNSINTSTTDVFPCYFSVSNGNLSLASNLSGSTKMYLKYNKSAKRFRFYKSGQEAIAAYRKTALDTDEPESPETIIDPIDYVHVPVLGVYDLAGRRLTRIPQKGFFILNGKRYIK